MASIRTHEEDCVRLLGAPYTHVHEWLDEYAKKWKPYLYLEYHRKFRHTKKAIEEAEFGFYELQAAKIHIIRDCELYVLNKPFDQVEVEEIDGLYRKALEFCHW